MLASMDTTLATRPVFEHEAMLYSGRADFMAQTVPFIRDAVVTDRPILVAVDQRKIEELRDRLGEDASKVRFEEMGRIGRNPARIIPVWRAFVEKHEGAAHGARGIGEPIWAGRSPDELVECERHEALLNLAFSSPPAAMRLICPYDTRSLPASVIAEARRNHPLIQEAGTSRPSPSYLGEVTIAKPFDAPLPAPAERPDEMPFDEQRLRDVRVFVTAQASARGVSRGRIRDLVLAVNEAVTNSIRYGGGSGLLWAWSQDGKMLCEVRDQGLIDRPLAGRVKPDPAQPSGYGLWLANQLCDLVQVRTSTSGSSIRLHMSTE